MSETASVTASSLAIAEKRPRKTGGCVGIFFQLFDWNRRFAKKKLFSKRLLPPDRAKESSKKFGGDEKLPKLRLIADENSGGFPNLNKNGVSTVDNSNVGKNTGVQTPSLVARLMGLESMPSVQLETLQKDFSGEIWKGRREKVVEDGEEFTRQEFRPQKLQKTGIVERRTVTRFGAEALQLKNVLSRSRKHHHHHKLASPVKSSANHARRNTSRLISAATRILEPGLQSRGRSKCAITYTRRPRGNEHRSGSTNSELVDSSSGHASCKNCGNLLDIAESTSKRDNHNHTSTVKLVQMSPNGKSRYVSSTFDQEQESWQLRNQQSQPQKFASPSNLKENTRKPVDVKNAVIDTKDFVSINRNLSGRTRSRVPPKVEDTKFGTRSTLESRRGSSGQLTRVRKQGERNATFRGKQTRPNACSERQPDYRGKSSKLGGGVNKNSDETNTRCEVPERRRNQNASPCKSKRKNSTSSQNDEKMCLRKPLPLSGSCLSALLEEKLKELANQVGYELGPNGTPPKRASANLLQDLICALNSEERPFPQKDFEVSPRRSRLPECRSHRFDHDTSFCSKPRSEKGRSLVGHKNIDHLSPGCVLEASFSNDSCCSSSLEGRTQHADSVCDDSQYLESMKDPFYAGDSFLLDNICSKLVADLLTNVSEAVHRVGLVNPGIKGNPLTLAYAKEILFNAELVVGSSNRNKAHSYFICCLLLELDTISEAMQNFLGNKGYQLKRFVFDCLIEYLDSKYCRFSRCGFRAWMKHPAFTGCEILSGEVVEEVRKWTGFVAETADQLVERDMSHSLGRWMDFEIESYEAAANIDAHILQMLMDEIVVDLTTGIACINHQMIQ